MLKPMQVRTLLAAWFSLFAILIIVVGAAGTYGIVVTNEALSDSAINVSDTLEVLQAQEGIARARILLDRLAAAHDTSAIESTLQSALSSVDDSNQTWSTYVTYPVGEEEKRLAQDVTRTRSQMLKEGLEPLIVAVKSGDADASHSLAFVTMPQLYAAFSQATVKLTSYQVQSSSTLVAQGKSRERIAELLTTVLIFVGVISAFVTWWLLRNSISKSLERAMEYFGRIEAGDLTSQIVVAREDEFGMLLHGLAGMQKSLRHTVITIRDSVNRVADAAGEIASGNNDLSQRTEQQAGTLEETAVSLEELSATIKQNAENVIEAGNLAQVMSESAGMNADAVRRLAETMSELKSGSDKIAEITAIIEGIAFQTNILALNAAVEAARAGEQGRGFAVVASEVRALAQRSGVAAKEIKDLIAASITRVDNGATQAIDVTQRVDNVLTAIGQVAALLSEISTASQEQAQGIEQITKAVSHMDKAVQQNAALVEEAAAASGFLSKQATTMREAVGGFQISGVSGKDYGITSSMRNVAI